MSFFRKSRRVAVSAPVGHLAYVRDDGTVLDLGAVTVEDLRLLNALTEVSYRHRGSKSGRRGISSVTLSRLRGLVSRWYGVINTPQEVAK